MLRSKPVLSVLLLLAVFSLLPLVLGVALAQRPARARAAPAPPAAVADLAEMSLSSRTAEFSRAMQERRVAPGQRAGYAAEFKKLPGDLQADILQRTSSKYAKASALEPVNKKLLDAGRVLVPLQIFRITEVWPNQGTAGGWSYALGGIFNTHCKALVDGAQVESYYIDMSEFFPRSVAFKVPAGATRGTNHPVLIRNTVSGKRTAAVSYRVVAPRSYRGYWGWQFHNFSDPAIPWKLYRDYFGASNVEYSNGTHRPAAQSWFDNTYTRAGSGGNCYGMSVSSLRYKNSQLGTFWHNWFAGAANHQNYLWWYPWRTETKETVQEDQGAWYTQEVLDRHNILYNTQSHRDCFNRVQTLVAQPTNKPVLIIWAPTWGHTMVPYRTEIAGDDHRIIVWDNNNPYSETETGSTDPSVGHVHWGANTFSYSSANKAVCMSYDECTPSTPHLPGASYGGPGANTGVAVVPAGTKVNQITDERGRTFYGPGGVENRNPATRIPMSSRLWPLVQRVLRRAAPAPTVPTNYAAVYVIGDIGGKSLTFNLGGTSAQKQFRFYMNGLVMSMQAAGTGDVRVRDLLRTNRALEVPNPTALRPTSFDVIASRAGAGDRVFQVRNLANLGAQALVLSPAPDGSRMEIQGAPGARMNMNLRGPLGAGEGQAAFTGLVLEAGTRADVAAENWGNLRTSGLAVRMRNLNTGAVQRQLRIPRQ